MLKFDTKRNILFAYKNKLAIPPEPKRGEHIDYTSLTSYISNQIEQDVRDFFMPKMLEVLKTDDIELFVSDIIVKQIDPGYFDNRNYSVMVKFGGTSTIGGSSEYVTILQIPSIDEEGILHYDRKKYSFIKMLEQDTTISYEDKKRILKLKLPRGTIQIVQSKSGPKIEFNILRSASAKKKYSLMNVLFALSKEQGLDPYEMFELFKNHSIRALFKTQDDLDMAINMFGGNVGAIDAAEYKNSVAKYLRGIDPNNAEKENDIYAVDNLRDELNSVLSLNRAIGKILADDVYSIVTPTKVVAKKGSVITETTLMRCKAEGVFRLLVDNTPNLEGYYLAQSVFIDFIPKGVPVIPEIQQVLPEEQGMYVSHDYSFNNSDPVIFMSDTRITKDLLTLFQKCGYSHILASLKPNKSFGDTDDTVMLYFSEEILSNRHFKASELSVASSFGDAWVYYDGTKLTPADKYINAWDMAALISLFAKLTTGECYEIITNADTGFRKRMSMVKDQYHKAFLSACTTGFSQMNRTLKETWNNNRFNFFVAERMDNNYFPFTKSFFKYLRDEAKCVQLINGDIMTNPISYMSGVTKVNIFKSSKHSIADEVRKIAIGSYGRIDPYETPQSASLGTVLNSSIGMRCEEDGTIKTPYYRVITLGNRTKVTKDIAYLTVKEEEQATIADITSLDLDDDGNVKNTDQLVLCRVPAKVSLEKQTFSYVPVSSVNYVNCYSNQYLSWSSACIPFMGCNDAARVVFGIAQEKAAKGLVNPDNMRVITYANLHIPMSNNEFCIIAQEDGICDIAERCITSMKTELHIGFHYDSQDGINEGTNFRIDEYTSTGYSVTLRKIEVVPGQRFKKGDVIMSSNFVKDGRLTIGVNAFVAFLADGYNYEDGSHPSSRLCNKLTSYRVNHEEFENPYKSASLSIARANHGKWLEPNKAPAFTLNMKLTGLTKKKNMYTTKAKGFLDFIKFNRSKNNFGVIKTDSIEASFVSVDPFSNGDKLSNRHGNKGVMSRKEDNSKMPRFKNGVPLDVVHNPAGVPSRMNIGQEKECSMGLVMEVLDATLCADAFNSISESEIVMLLKYTVELMNSTGDPRSITSKYKDIPEEFHERNINNINKIRRWAGCFDENGEAYLILPDNGNKLTKTKVKVGVIAVSKLIQESDKKAHARAGLIAGEPYTVIGNAPTKGASAHGGQRFGTMEMDALCAYGASNIIDELVNYTGDNPVMRNNINAEVFLPESIAQDYMVDGYSQRRSTTQFLYTMLALGNVLESDGEFVELSKDNSNIHYYKSRELALAGSCINVERNRKSEDSNNVTNNKSTSNGNQGTYFNQMEDAYSALVGLMGGENH